MPSTNGLEIVQIPAGPLETNAFLVIDSDSRQSLIIDGPPDSLDKIAREVEQRGVTPQALVLTHTHWDHIGDVAAIKERFGIPVVVHELERERIEQPSPVPMPIAPASVDRALSEGDEVTLGSHTFQVLHTPGHSPGQVSLYCEAQRAMLGGDTLFPDGYGRADITGSSEDETVATMRRLLQLPDDVTVYPGHGRSTTIGRERPWMEQVDRTGRLLG